MANTSCSFSPHADHTSPSLLPIPTTFFCCPITNTTNNRAEKELQHMIHNNNTTAFTASQLEELHVQALICKHMLMAVPLPLHLLLSLHQSMPARFCQEYPSLSYCSCFGKKLDPEPDRCRRTDGKKWRCSKNAYTDSKYCERHMHRSKNRSRKPVESQSTSPTASTVTSDTRGAFQGFLMPSSHKTHLSFARDPISQLEFSSFGTGAQDFRSHSGMKAAEVGEHSFFSETSGTARRIGIDSTLDSSWGLMPSHRSLLPASRVLNGSNLESSYNQLPGLDDHRQASTNLYSRQEQTQHSLFGDEYLSVEPAKQSQSLRPFFDEWPNSRGPWSDLEEQRANRTSFSTTQLSISIPMATSDFSTTSSISP